MGPLLLSRRFAPLFACQFFAAFNDNFLKTALVFLILFGGRPDAAALITLASAIFIAPFFFLSALGGELADRYDKARVAQWLKFAEIFVAAVAVVGYARASLPILFTALAGFGVLAALFGPLKYGILPDHLRAREIAGRQRAGRGRDLHRHPDRHHRRRACLGRRRGAAVRAAGDGLCARLLAGGAADSAERRGRAAVARVRQHRRLDLGDDPPFARRRAAVVGRAGDELVLARRHRGAVAAAAADQDAASAATRRRSPPISRCSRSRSGSARARRRRSRAGASCSRRRSSARRCSGCSRSISALRARRRQRRRCRRRPRCFPPRSASARRSISAGLAIGGGLFIVPAFAAVQAWSSPDYRARTIAAVNVLNAAFMTGGDGAGGAVAEGGRHACRCCSWASARRRCWWRWRSGRRCRRL